MVGVGRIGVLGGTFDPIHYGHLAAAEEARAKLSLREVIFVVAGLPPHKLDEEITSAEHRYAMVELAIASNPHFSASRIDIDRPGPSYTVDTIALLRQKWTEEIYFIMGMDSLMEIDTWHQPQRLIQLCRLVAVERPSFTPDLERLEAAMPGITARTEIIEMPQMEISSTDLQRRVREGLPIKYQVPPEVEEYIYQHRLYLEKAKEVKGPCS
ncbi:MAG TPA: nicotinic acid mononucleotide adenylyltransferase [Chloroflexi bacterium]|nr:nicotinic acid mononucleotide adenylyltransferase [Chloroflexota bacterium]